MFGLRPLEILLIVLAIFLLFGATRLPQLARSIGQSRKAFKDALRDSGEDDVPPASASKQINTASALTDEEILAEVQRRTAAGSKA
jgi:sec-independent protein translocase protein TatA